MKKRALLVGINYVGTGHPLKGCINDVKNIESLLRSRGFADIEIILEKEATTANIMAGLRRLVAGATPGDVIFFHYSGHGSQTFSTLEPDMLDEIICPIDIDWVKNVITDNELKDIFNPVPNGVNVTIILDCCHSGTGMDHHETAVIDQSDFIESEKVRVVTRSMKQRHLPPPASVLSKVKRKKMVLRDWDTSRDINKSALLLAACMPHQTAADATISGIPQGAATASIIAATKMNPEITYLELFKRMSGFMVTNRFTQRPQLDGSSFLYQKKFLDSWALPAVVVEPQPAVVVEPQPIPSILIVPPTVIVEPPPVNNKQDKKVLIIGAAILLLVVLFLVIG